MRSVAPPLPSTAPLSGGPSGAAASPVLQVGAPFSAAELRAMVLDGLITLIYGSTYLKAGEPLTGGLRAQAASRTVSGALRDKMTIGRLSAAWVYGCAPAPEVVSLLTDHGRRTTAARPFSGAVVHEVDLPARDVANVSGVPVTIPLRTACDLALYVDANRSASALRAMGNSPALGCALPRVHEELSRLRRVPRKLAALALVESLLQGG